MRFRVAAVGRLRRGFYTEGCAYYLKRLQAFGRAEVLEVKDGRGAEIDQVREAEAEGLLSASEGRLIALDERGQSYRSEELARRFDELELRGESTLTLVIGGAEGLHDKVRSSAQESWSLSPFTLPHELARLVLLEQLYRAETIRKGHPYHRE